MARLLIIEARADVDMKDAKTEKSLIDLQQYDEHALSSEIILALVHERYVFIDGERFYSID